MSKISNIVLVHGAWADASSWSKVIPLLQAKGYQATSVAIPLTSFPEDVAATKRAIAGLSCRQAMWPCCLILMKSQM